MAFSFTGDLGCEFGGGVSCYGDKAGGPKQSFIGYMIYNRFWFHRDMFGVTVGGGQINNPGRYLVLIRPSMVKRHPPRRSNSPYFTGNPGDPFKAWDSSLTFDYMPRQWLHFPLGVRLPPRECSVLVWSRRNNAVWFGRSALYNNGSPQFYACNDGNSSLQPNRTRSGNCLRSTGQHRMVPRSAQR